jgi:hypothetical protein
VGEVRSGGSRIRIYNSGCEVWLYDDASTKAIRKMGWEKAIPKATVVGYGMLESYPVDIAVHVGEPLTDSELSATRWLEPQRAFLKLPSGLLRVETNDSSRIGEEDPTDKGALLEVPAGDYRLTLYRVDREALERESLAWSGPHEVVVLTPGGSAKDAAKELLPHLPRRDLAHVGQYTIQGRRAQALAWFDDPWTTLFVNLDPPALARLGLKEGGYFAIRSPELGLELTGVFSSSWARARELDPPRGVSRDEYVVGTSAAVALCNYTAALFCNRERARQAIPKNRQKVWLPVELEVLDAVPDAPPEIARIGPNLLRETALAEKTYFDTGTLPYMIGPAIPEAESLDILPLPKALELLDAAFAELALAPRLDIALQRTEGETTVEIAFRVYAGRPDAFALLIAGSIFMDIVLLTETAGGEWAVTGIANLMMRLCSAKPGVRVTMAEEPLPAMLATHLAAVKGRAATAPSTREEAVAAFLRFFAKTFV